MREYINTKESYFNNISDFPEVSVGKLLKKFFYYKCNECGEIKSKRIYSENRKIKVDFTCRECKYKNTSKERYGTNNPAQSEKIKEITKKNNLEKYGVDNPAKLESIKEKSKETNLKKYGTIAPCQNYEVLKKCFKNIFYDSAQEMMRIWIVVTWK